MRKIVRLYVLQALCLSWAFSVLGLFGKLHFIFDIMSNFRMHYVISGALCFAVFLMFKTYVNAGLSIALILFNSIYIVPWYIGNTSGSSKNGVDVKIFMNNVHTRNSSSETLIERIKNSNPDIVLLLEVNRRWVESLGQIEKEFKYSVISDREDNFGIALYSKLPIANKAIQYYGDSVVPSIFVELKSDNGNFTFICTHPLPPISQEYYDSRNKQLRALAKEADLSNTPFVLAGDLNTTMWSSHYKVLETDGGLRNTRFGRGIFPTWPSMVSWFGIPIDHILVSTHFIVQSFDVGQSTGSDHLPINVSLTFERMKENLINE